MLSRKFGCIVLGVYRLEDKEISPTPSMKRESYRQMSGELKEQSSGQLEEPKKTSQFKAFLLVLTTISA